MTSVPPFVPPADHQQAPQRDPHRGQTATHTPVRRWWAIPGFRLLPVVMVMAVCLLGFKMTHVAAGVGALLAAPASSQDGSRDGSQTVASDPGGVEAIDLETLAAIEPAAGQEDGDGADRDGGRNASQPAFMSRSEVDLLQDLSDRRRELNNRSDQLDTRERLLMATEQRIDRKIERLKGMEASIKDMLRIHSEEEEKQIKSLVRVYEAMKPRDAARILERLEMDILVSVVERMGERRIAPVLAQMNPEVATAVTSELALRKEMPAMDEES